MKVLKRVVAGSGAFALVVFGAVGSAWAQVPDPAPAAPPGADRITTVLGWAKWVALAACGLGGIAGAGMAWAGQSRGMAGQEEQGKKMVIAALAGAMVIGVVIVLVNGVFTGGGGGN
jgi:hypothetical protein